MNYVAFRQTSVIMFLALVLVMSACEKRYWYRTKINTNLFEAKTYPRRTVNIEILNYSPDFISKDFERSIQEASLLELNKRGFVLSKKDTPNYHLYIFLQVDSYYVYGSKGGYVGTRNIGHVVTKNKLGGSTSNSLRQKNTIKELAFSYRMICPKNGNIYWESNDGLYFFNREDKDIKRSVGLVSYNLSRVP